MTSETINNKIRIGGIIIVNNQQHDKILKYLFNKEGVAIKFINDVLEIEGKEDELKENQLERSNSEFINKIFGKLQADIVYRKKGTLIYYVIEHQSTVDYRMPVRMMEYSVAVMSEVEKQHGKKDINDYTREELLKEEGALEKVLLLEKARNEKDVAKIMEEILKQNLNEEEKDVITYALESFLKDSINEELSKEIIKKLKENGCNIMIVENLERIYKNVEKRGERIGREKVAKRMLKKGMSIEEVQSITQLGINIISKLKV